MLIEENSNLLRNDSVVDQEDDRIFHGYLYNRFKKFIPNIYSRWKAFKKKLQVSLSHPEERSRFFIYAKNLVYISLSNARNEDYLLEENNLAYLSRQEYFQLLGAYPGSSDQLNITKNTKELDKAKRQNIVVNIDWRKRGVLNPVQDQGICGSCYAFASVSTVEALVAIHTKKLYKFSEQAVVDCSKSYSNMGCLGGYSSRTFDYIMKYPMVSAKQYPYVKREQTCKIVENSDQAVISGYVQVDPLDEYGIIEAIQKNPLFVSVDARQPSFQFYKSGIYKDKQCSTDDINHAVNIVGAISVGPNPVYIIRNSWGSRWGENGHIRIPMFQNQCGVARDVKYPVIK